MDQFNSRYMYQQSISKPRSRQPIIAPDFAPPASENMMRESSNDSAYFSAIPDDANFPPKSPLTISYGAESSNTVDMNDFFSSNMQPFGRDFVVNASASFELGPTSSTTPPRITPSDRYLNWHENSSHYRFVVPKGQEPFFELIDGYSASDYTIIPQKVYLDYPRVREKNVFPCQYPACNETVKSFRRPADLERHYRNVHAEEDQKDNFFCDYPPCETSRGPFHRKDHFRDHLRDYHKEDIGVPKAPKKERNNEQKLNAIKQAWIAERRIVPNRWRCPKCLQRIIIEQDGYFCIKCNNPCDRECADRIDVVRARGRVPLGLGSTGNGMDDVRHNATIAPTAATTASASASAANTNTNFTCFTCQGLGYCWDGSNGDSGWCPACNPSGGQYRNDEDLFDDRSYASSSRY